MPKRLLLIAVTFLVFCNWIGTPEAAANDIPDTPVGVQLRWAIEAFSGRDGRDPTPRFDPEFIRMLPESLPEPRAATAIFAARQGVFQFGQARLIRIHEGATETSLRADIKAEKSGTEYLLLLSVNTESGLINGFLLTHDTSRAPKGLDSWQAVSQAISDLPGEVSILVARAMDDGEATPHLEPIYAAHPDRRLAIGSAFKLWVLGAIAELIREGEATWDEPLALDPTLQTMPIGALRMEAERRNLGQTASFPLSRYADLMISISDNPATDHLIRYIGQERIIEFMARTHGNPDVNTPFLTTGEMFKLKCGVPDEVLADYVASTTPRQRAEIIASEAFENANIDLAKAVAWPLTGPIAIDSVEWFASAEELAWTMLELRRLEQGEGMASLARSLRINDGINLNDEIWPSVSYKGGSEPGVLNLTFLAEHREGGLWAVSLGWNNTEAGLDEDRLIHLAVAIFSLIDSGRLPEGITPPVAE